MVNGWLVFLGLVNAYILLIVWLVRTGRMERWKLSLLLGFILMIRTQRGRRTLEVVAKPRRFWNLFGDFGIVLSFLGMAVMTIGVLLALGPALDPDSGLEPLGASEILIIPGVTPFVPLWYGIIALIVTLVVHEGGHGVLALANRMRVKNLGLLYCIIPVGAFVEPDEDDLMESPRRNRLRVYAAGATVNIVLAMVVLVASASLMGSLEPHDGVPIASIVADTAAEQAGMQPGDILVAANGTALPDAAAFFAFMDTTAPGQQVTFDTRDGAQRTAVLGDRWDRLLDEEKDLVLDEDPEALEACRLTLGLEQTPTGAECAEGLANDPFLGVQPFLSKEQLDRLAHPFSSLGGFFLYVTLPLGEIQGAPFLTFYLPEFYETPFDHTTFWIVANIVFFVFWINFLVGLTNILPMLPLDGGHLFRDGMGGLLGRLRPRLEPERRDRIVGRLATIVSLVILGAVVLQFLGPRLVAGL